MSRGAIAGMAARMGRSCRPCEFNGTGDPCVKRCQTQTGSRGDEQSTVVEVGRRANSHSGLVFRRVDGNTPALPSPDELNRSSTLYRGGSASPTPMNRKEANSAAR